MSGDGDPQLALHMAIYLAVVIGMSAALIVWTLVMD